MGAPIKNFVMVSVKQDETRKSYKDIESYLADQPPAVRTLLEELRQTIKKAVPQATELISYQMPAFRHHGILLYYAAFKKHYSVFARPVILQAFKKELADYSQTKSAIHIPLDKPVPKRLVTKIAQYVAKQNEEKQALKLKKKN
jgi:uncharacterized protein YdhG (YjbR/CyaY superfamily)